MGLTNTVHAQAPEIQKESKLNVYLDFGTNILISSALINAEYNIFRNADRSLRLYARFGVGYATNFFGYGAHGPGVLPGLTMLIGEKNHRFQAGAGGFFGAPLAPGLYHETLRLRERPFFIPDLHMGYRYQRPEGGLIFIAKGGVLGIGMGLGYAF